MKIYKFKDLTDEKKRPHFYQMVLHNSMWCAKPGSLNDEMEFDFKLNYAPFVHTANLLSQVVKRYRTTDYFPPDLSVSFVMQHKQLEEITVPIIEQMISNCRDTIGITSFSATKNSDHLWKEYGGNGNGACIEIEISDEVIKDRYHQVCYVPEKVFHIDSFLESALFPEKAYETFRNLLLTKTNTWKREKEIRFVSKMPEVNAIFDGRITEIILGANIPANAMNQVEETINNHCRLNGIIITVI